MSFSIDVLGTGSDGNSIVIDNELMIDIGLNVEDMSAHLRRVSAVFVTHRHGDHLRTGAVNWLATKRPTFAENCLYLNEDSRNHVRDRAPKAWPRVAKAPVLTDSDDFVVRTRQGRQYRIETFPLVHDVENQGFVITNEQGESLIHITDTMTASPAPRRKYDYLLVEGNWDEDLVEDMIENGSPAQRDRALRNMRHLSVQAFETFVRKHSHPDSKVLQLHKSMELGSDSLMSARAGLDAFRENLDDEDMGVE